MFVEHDRFHDLPLVIPTIKPTIEPTIEPTIGLKLPPAEERFKNWISQSTSPGHPRKERGRSSMSHPPVKVEDMTVLDFDPPQPSLRLVSSNGPAAHRNLRYRTSTPLYGEARELYRDVLEFAFEHQTTIDPDALRVVLATKQATTAAPGRAFSATGIWQLMFVDIVTWCTNRKLDVPLGCATALIRVVEYLEATSSFDELSDRVDDLYEAIDECTGGWTDDPHPTTPAKGRRSLPSERDTKRT
jgi:hypothetical protein